MLIRDLNDTDNMFVIINPADESLSWWASVTRIADGRFEIVRRDPSRDQHDVDVEADIDRIAADLTIWLAGRGYHRGHGQGSARRGPAEPARFTLTTERHSEYRDPDDRRIEWALSKLSDDNYFAILTRADGWFVQVGYGTSAGVAPGTYAMEYQEGSTDKHFASHTTDINAATRFMQEFLAGVDTWKRRHAWRRLHLSRGDACPEPTPGVLHSRSRLHTES